MTSASSIAPPTPIIPMSRWGKDHWSMLAYAETLCVDGQPGTKGVGKIDHRRVRCNPAVHPMQNVNTSVSWQPNYGTCLRGYFQLENRQDLNVAVAAGMKLVDHDDWSVLDDLEAAGLVDIISTANGFITMTPKGMGLAAQLRQHKAGGGHFATFEPSVEAIAA